MDKRLQSVDWSLRDNIFIQGILNCIAAVCGLTLAFLHYQETKRALKNKVILAMWEFPLCLS